VENVVLEVFVSVAKECPSFLVMMEVVGNTNFYFKRVLSQMLSHGLASFVTY
jgi:hypothetical protein